MVREMAFATEPNMSRDPLWRGVIARAIQDWVSKPLRPKRQAERYLFENSADLSMVCSSAGLDVLKLRTCLNKVRGLTLEDVLAGFVSHELRSQSEGKEHKMPSIVERELIEVRHEWTCTQCRWKFYNPGCILDGLTLDEIILRVKKVREQAFANHVCLKG
jgi:hypothetical protein